MGFRTPLARVRGLGSAKDGTQHWWAQRVTAVAMVPLSLWLIYAISSLSLGTLAELQQWLQSPTRAVLLTAFIGAMAYHAKLGVQVVVEDYVHRPLCKFSLLLINTLGFTLLFLMAVIAIFKLHTL